MNLLMDALACLVLWLAWALALRFLSTKGEFVINENDPHKDTFTVVLYDIPKRAKYVFLKVKRE